MLARGSLSSAVPVPAGVGGAVLVESWSNDTWVTGRFVLRACRSRRPPPGAVLPSGVGLIIKATSARALGPSLLAGGLAMCGVCALALRARPIDDGTGGDEPG
jgi:hypothetical protein